MIKQSILLVCFLSFFCVKTKAQEMGLYFLDGLWQASQLNPAFVPDERFVFSFPSIALNLHHTASSYNDLHYTDANGKNIFSLDDVLGNMKSRNFARLHANLETIHFSFGGKIWRASLSHAVKFRTQLGYPKALAQLAWNGNEQFVGQTVQIGPDFQSVLYSELAAGFGMDIYKLRLGGRIKLLSGIFDMSTGSNFVTVTTDEEIYQLTFNTDYQINLAALKPYGSLSDFEPQFGFSLLGKNPGFGLDLGAAFEINEQLSVSASIIDLGWIKWKTNSQNHTSKGNYTFEGLDVNELVRDDSATFESTIDTLETIFDFQKTSHSYTTMLPGKMYLGASFKVSPMLRLGGVIYTEHYRKHLFKGVALNSSIHLGKIFTAGLVYSIFNRTL